MSNILFISHDVVGSAMAGPGIRAFELTRVLAGEHDVTLAVPRVTDGLLRGLLRVVPFGLPSTPPIRSAPPWPDLGTEALVILWSGGLWDWMDPLTLIRAMPTVLAQVPGARLVFLAGQNPGNDYPMQMPG